MATMLTCYKAEHSSDSAHKLKQPEVPGEGRVSLVHQPGRPASLSAGTHVIVPESTEGDVNEGRSPPHIQSEAIL